MSDVLPTGSESSAELRSQPRRHGVFYPVVTKLPDCESGDDPATALLAELGWVRALARTLVGQDADDLVQDVALSAWTKRPGSSRLPAWLATVTKNRARNLLRGTRREANRRAGIDAAPTADSPPVTLQRLELQRDVAHAVLELPEPYRTTLVERFVEGRDAAAIATLHQVSPATVRKRVQRAKAMLRAKLVDRWGGSWRQRALLCVGLPHGVKTLAASTLGGTAIMTKKTMTLVGVLLLSAIGIYGVVSLLQPATVDESSQPSPAQVVQNEPDRAKSAAPVEVSESASRVEVLAAEVPDLTVCVTDSTGVPVPAVDVFVVEGDALQEGVSDVRGVVRFDGIARGALLAVFPTNRPPVLTQLRRASGEHEVEFSAGRDIFGHARLQDGQPLTDCVMWLGIEACVPKELPSVLEARFLRCHRVASRLTTRTGSNGEFKFHDLPESWAGELRVRKLAPYSLLHVEPKLSVTAFTRVALPRPIATLELTFTALPSIQGRVVWSTGEPVPFANGMVSGCFDGCGTGFDCRADADGRFEAMLLPRNRAGREEWSAAKIPVPESANYSFSHPQARAASHRTIQGSSWPLDGDVGDVVLERAESLWVKVEDSDGQPIEGVGVTGAGRAVVSTNNQGHVLVPVAELNQREFMMGAAGCVVEVVRSKSGVGTEDDPLCFELRPQNCLQIQVQAFGLDLGLMQLEVVSGEPIFTGGASSEIPEPLLRIAGNTSPIGSSTRHGERCNWFPIEADGRVVLASLHPNATVTIRVKDALHMVLLEREIVTPAVGKTEAVRLQVEHGVTQVNGVVTRNGEPVADASILGTASTGFASARSDRNGRFTMTLASTGDDLLLEAPNGFSPASRQSIARHPGVVSVELELGVTRPVTVTIRHADGRAVDAKVSFNRGLNDFGVVQLGPGHVRYESLPIRVHTVKVTWQDWVFSRSYSGETQHLEFVVPNATVPVKFVVTAKKPRSFVGLRLESVDHAGLQRSVELRQPASSAAGFAEQTLQLFPGTYEVHTTLGRRQSFRKQARWVVKPDGGNCFEVSLP